MKYCITGCMMILLILSPVLVQSQVFNARLNTTVYSWEQQLLDEQSATHMRAYQIAQFSVARFGVKGLSFYTYLNASNDFAEQATDDARLWIYNCYLRYRASQALELRAGRQRVYAGVGYGTIDGLQAQYAWSDLMRVKVYAGYMSPLRRSYELGSADDNSLSWGFQFSSTRWKRFRMAISYAQQSRVAVPYSTAGLFSGTYRLTHPLSALQRRLVGIDLKGQLTSSIRAHGRLDYNDAMHQVKRMDLGARYQCRKTEIGLDYIYRTPFFDFNSIFWVFDVKPNQEIGLRTSYRKGQQRYSLNAATILFDGESSRRLGVGWGWKTIYVSLQNRAGYGGDLNGLSISAQYPLHRKLAFVLGSNFYQYKLYDEADSEIAFAGTCGLNARLGKKMSIQGQLHYLNNVYFSSDVRFLLQANYAFSYRSK